MTWLSSRVRSHNAAIIRNRRNVIDVALSTLKHKLFKDLPPANGCSKLSRLKKEIKDLCITAKSGKLQVENSARFGRLVAQRSLRNDAINRFLSNHSIPHKSIDYEDLTSRHDDVRIDAWCSVEHYIKNTFCNSSCAVSYIGNALECGNTDRASNWCATFADKFKSATPLRNHTDIISNAAEVYAALPSDVKMKYWRGPHP